MQTPVKFLRKTDDYGAVYEMTCPECQERLRLSDGDTRSCECGLVWTLHLQADGTGPMQFNPLETMDDVTFLRELARVLATQERMGAAEDEPEGVRYIQLSDTLAHQIAARLRRMVE